MRPGEHLHVELQLGDGERIAKLVFASADAVPGQYSFYALLHTESETACTVSPGNGRQCEIDGATIHYLDPRGSKYEIDPNDIIGQRKAITELRSHATSCKFHPEREEQERTTARLVGATRSSSSASTAAPTGLSTGPSGAVATRSRSAAPRS